MLESKSVQNSRVLERMQLMGARDPGKLAASHHSRLTRGFGNESANKFELIAMHRVCQFEMYFQTFNTFQCKICFGCYFCCTSCHDIPKLLIILIATSTLCPCG